MSMLRAILFDAYGTLISTGTGSVDAARRILTQRGRQDIPAERFYARWKQLHRAHMDGAHPFVDEQTIFAMDLRALYAEYGIAGDADSDVGVMLDSLIGRRAFPESRAVLETLGGRFMTCIASTTDTEPLMHNLRLNDLRVGHVFTSELLRAYKPQPEFYLRLLGRLGLEAGEALFVGDSLLDDVRGPQGVGMRACWVNRKGARAEDASPDYEVSDLTGLIDVVQSCG